MKKTEIYYPDGRVLERVWEDGTRPAYAWMSRAVGGLIEHVGGFLEGEREEAYANEEGRLLGLDVNVPGMKALNWPEPPMGWASVTPRPAGAAPSMVLVHPGMSGGELESARRELMRWQPVVGPILVMRGWSDDEYDDEEGVDPGSLGAER
jgi:hypothetical protein